MTTAHLRAGRTRLPNPPGPDPSPRAFTLIELLVVISIIALLIGILLPALSAARNQALNMKCQAGIRSLGQAYTAYLLDYEDFAPFDRLLPGNWNSDPGGSLRNPVILIEQSPLLEYITADRDEVLVCPVFRRTVEDIVAEDIPSIGVSFSYVLNGGIDPSGEMAYKPFDNRPYNLGQVRKPSELSLFVEENPWGHPEFGPTPMNDGRFVTHRWPDQDTLATYHYPGSENYGSYPTSDTNPVTNDMNNGRSHAVFVDGHVEIVETTQSEWVSYEDREWANRPEYWP